MTVLILMAVVFLGACGVAAGCKWRWRPARLAVVPRSRCRWGVPGAGGMVCGRWYRPSLAWLALVFAWWAFVPRDDLPRNRVRRQNIRLQLRLAPGPRARHRLFELHRHWGRLASARKARYARPNLTRAERLMRPGEHSVFLGRAQYRHGLRLPIEEHAAVFSPPRTGKTGWLSTVVLHYPGPVLSTTTRADVYKDTVRARSGGRPGRRVQPAAGRRRGQHHAF